MNPTRPVIPVIDETIREGMQYRGVMFSLEQRKRILDFQERLGVDICQAGYPSAHEAEAEMVTQLVMHARKMNYNVRVAAMGRVNLNDIDILTGTGVKDFHLHLFIPPKADQTELEDRLSSIITVRDTLLKSVPDAVISIALLDIGKSAWDTLEYCVDFCSRHLVDILSLPDTSGIMAPNQVFDTFNGLTKNSIDTQLSVHCHNDMGMASANTCMGILGGGQILEASVLGIGERNGIADLYTTAKMLQSQGLKLRLRTGNGDEFKAYYQFIDTIVFEQLGHRLLWENTPVFGDAVKTHVAGTHSDGTFASVSEERYDLNGLCGKHLVKKFLNLHQIGCPETLLGAVTHHIKTQSYALNRRLSVEEVKKIIVLIADSG